MPNRRKGQFKKRSRKNNAGSSSVRAPSNAAVAYRGPIRAPNPEHDAIVVSVRGYNTITSTAGGVLSPIYINTDPFNLSLASFTTYATIYRSYRVLALKVNFTPVVQGAVNNVLISGTPFLHGTVRKASSAAAAYSDVSADADARQTAINMPWTHSVRAQSPEEMLYISTGITPPNIFAIETYASGMAATTVYGATLVTYIVQFKTRYA